MEYKLSQYIVVTDSTMGGKYKIVYSTRTSNVLLLTSKVVDQIFAGDYMNLDKNILSQLISCEMLVDKNEDELATIIGLNEKAIENTRSLYYVIQPTAACQMGCAYCGQAHSKNNLNDKFYPRILQRLEGKLFMNPNYKRIDIGWFGSEPLLGYKHIKQLTPQIMELAEKYNCEYHAKIVTNGMSLKKSVFLTLVKLGVEKFEITLDGTAEYHDARRHTKEGGSTFDIIFKNLKEIFSLPDFESYGAEITIRCNVDSTNHQGVEDLINLLKEHDMHKKIFSFYVAPIHSWGNDAHKLSLEKQAFAEREIEWLSMLMEKGFPVGLLPAQAERIVCMAVKKDAEIIDAFGNVYNCTETPYVPGYEKTDYWMGNIAFPDEAIAPKSDPLVNWNQDVLDNKFPCSTCKILPLCGGACPKQWHENNCPCPSIKHNVEQRLFLYTKHVLDLAEKKKTANAVEVNA